jgi:RecJ-like exonuclease
MEMKIKELIEKAHSNAVKRDLYRCRDCGGDGDFKNDNWDVVRICTNCNGTGKTEKLNVYNDMKKELEEFINSKPLQYFHKDSEQSEISDMILILLAYCKEQNYDIEKALIEKSDYNITRE